MIAFMIAGTASSVGKTTAALAVMAGLHERGLRVQPFKCGPDFLDGGHHSVVCGRPSRNLDTWMLSREGNRDLFANAIKGAGAVVVEGMMGLYDGVSGGGEAGSSAEIAKLLNLPVVLVLDASKSARSIAAIVKGFLEFDRELRFVGVLLNGVNSENHYRLLGDAIRSATSVPLIGRIPRASQIAIPERHLGLRTVEEETDRGLRREALATIAREHLDIEALVSATEYIPSSSNQTSFRSGPEISVRFGVPRDKAFSFYYEDNLDLLRRIGAEAVSFSPLEDAHLPENLDGLYLGGGYPELYAPQLSANRTMLAEIREFADSGRPVYAECGGMVYLGEAIRLLDGTAFSMCGVLPLHFAMTDKLVHFGYVQVRLTDDCLLGNTGDVARGHSFHYSRVESADLLPTTYRLSYSLSGRTELEGFRVRNVLASYIHLHFLSNPSMAQSLVRHASAQQQAEVNQ